MGPKRRRLTSDEHELWEKVKHSTRPIRRERPEKAGLPQNNPAPMNNPAGPPAKTPAIKQFQVGEAARTATKLPDMAATSSGAVHRKITQRMKRGKLAPEGRIDLHGMTQARAHPALTGFILQSVAMDRRMVLVITGKGRTRDDEGPIPERIGVLRQAVPNWLRSGQLAGLVVDVVPAHARHGGEGAFYVFLKRGRG